MKRYGWAKVRAGLTELFLPTAGRMSGRDFAWMLDVRHNRAKTYLSVGSLLICWEHPERVKVPDRISPTRATAPEPIGMASRAGVTDGETNQ